MPSAYPLATRPRHTEYAEQSYTEENDARLLLSLAELIQIQLMQSPFPFRHRCRRELGR